jgi:MFS family permease
MSDKREIPTAHDGSPGSKEQTLGPSQEIDTETRVDQFLVNWDVDDRANPQNWSTAYKSWATFQLALLALAGSLASSSISPATPYIARTFNVSDELAIASVSLYVLGFAFGPSCWGPLSEIWGRRWSMLPAVVALGCFSIATATSQNIQSVLVSRFFSGVFGSAPVSNVSAALGDMWSPQARGTAMCFYAIAVLGGTTLGPVVGSAFLVNDNVGWRWIG